MLYETKTLKLRLGAKRNSMRYDAKSRTLYAPEMLSVCEDVPSEALYISQDAFIEMCAENGCVELAHKVMLTRRWFMRRFNELPPVRTSPEQRLAFKFDGLVRTYVHPFGALACRCGDKLVRLDVMYLEPERTYLVYELAGDICKQYYVCVENHADCVASQSVAVEGGDL